MTRNQKMKYGSGALLVLVSTASQAAIDVTAVTTGITDAQTAILAVIGGLLGLSVAIFGIVKVYHFVSKKSGA